MGTLTARKLSHHDLAEALQHEPFVGVTRAAKILGIKPPNFKRDAAPHLTALPVEGSASIYFLHEVEELRDEWQEAARKADGRRSAAREEPSNGKH